MQLEDYFDFLGPHDIRLKGHRIGIESVLYEYLFREQTPSFRELSPLFRKYSTMIRKRKAWPCTPRASSCMRKALIRERNQHLFDDLPIFQTTCKNARR